MCRNLDMRISLLFPFDERLFHIDHRIYNQLDESTVDDFTFLKCLVIVESISKGSFAVGARCTDIFLDEWVNVISLSNKLSGTKTRSFVSRGFRRSAQIIIPLQKTWLPDKQFCAICWRLIGRYCAALAYSLLDCTDIRKYHIIIMWHAHFPLHSGPQFWRSAGLVTACAKCKLWLTFYFLYFRLMTGYAKLVHRIHIRRYIKRGLG